MNPVLHTELNQVLIHSTLYHTLKKYYINKSEIPTFKKLISYQKYIEPNQDLFKELKSLLEILDLYRKTETLKNEQKLQFVQDRKERQNGDIFFKSKIIQQLKILLKGARESNILIDETENGSELQQETEINAFLRRKIHNLRWRNIIRDLYASRDDHSSIVPLAKRPNTPRSDESRASSSSSSSGNVFHKSHFLINEFEEIDLELERKFLNIEYLMKDEGAKLLNKLREAFKIEKSQLLSDVEYIRHVLDDEAEFNYKASNFIIPTTQELNEIEQHLSEMVDHMQMQEKMDKLTSTKVSKLLTPRKQKLTHSSPEKEDLSTNFETALDTSSKTNTLGRSLKPFSERLSSLSSLSSIEKTSTSLNPINLSDGKKINKENVKTNNHHDSNTESLKLSHRVTVLPVNKEKDKDSKELSSFLNGNESSDAQITKRRSRPSTASRLRNAVLSSRTG